MTPEQLDRLSNLIKDDDLLDQLHVATQYHIFTKWQQIKGEGYENDLVRLHDISLYGDQFITMIGAIIDEHRMPKQ